MEHTIYATVTPPDGTETSEVYAERLRLEGLLGQQDGVRQTAFGLSKMMPRRYQAAKGGPSRALSTIKS